MGLYIIVRNASDDAIYYSVIARQQSCRGNLTFRSAILQGRAHEAKASHYRCFAMTWGERFVMTIDKAMCRESYEPIQ